jgi:hypothetical protein
MKGYGCCKLVVSIARPLAHLSSVSLKSLATENAALIFDIELPAGIVHHFFGTFCPSEQSGRVG